jgi:hypothetical protein
VHTYSVEFRIWTDRDDLDFEEISRDLGIVPNNTRQRGQAMSRSRTSAESMWGYIVYPKNSDADWDSLDEGLQAMLRVFLPLKEKVRSYAAKHDVVLWCGHFTSSFDGGPTFSPEVLRGLGELGVELFLDTYCSSDSTEETA